MGRARATVDALMQHGRRAAKSPFADLRRRRGVTWLPPSVTAEVTFAELVAGRLRAPVLRSITVPRDGNVAALGYFSSALLPATQGRDGYGDGRCSVARMAFS
jgi:hypothetical protein